MDEMSIYETHILARASDHICSSGTIMGQRQKVVPRARGRVLEIGIGSGLNLPFYDESKVEMIWGLDPAAAGLARAEKRVRETTLKVEFVRSKSEEIPLDSNSADTVLTTYTLCTIPDLQRALAEIRRVLRPGGDLIFCEHGLAPDEKVRRWQYRLNPFWSRIGGGCNLTRPIPRLIEQGGFRINDIEAGYIQRWRPASYNFWGSASPRRRPAHGGG